ncbi:hypothetical protein U1Q18_001631 [Sarracenia purpurea var. burkii]
MIAAAHERSWHDYCVVISLDNLIKQHQTKHHNCAVISLEFPLTGQTPTASTEALKGISKRRNLTRPLMLKDRGRHQWSSKEAKYGHWT